MNGDGYISVAVAICVAMCHFPKDSRQRAQRRVPRVVPPCAQCCRPYPNQIDSLYHYGLVLIWYADIRSRKRRWCNSLRQSAGGIEFRFPSTENRRFWVRIAGLAKIRRVLNDHS